MSAQSRLSAFFVRGMNTPVLLMLAVLLGVTLTAVAARVWRVKTVPFTGQGAAVVQSTSAATNGYVRRAALSPRLREAFKVLGDRLEKPGKERLTLTGTIKRGDLSAAHMRLILETPGRLRLEEQANGQPRITIFDGQKLISTDGRADRLDLNLIESLVFDTADHFFAAQIQGSATRFLGPRFRLDEGRTPGYRGPFYDLYQVIDRIPIEQQAREQQKIYHFNSDTALLEQVRYQVIRDGSPVRVATLFSGWRAVNGQQIPGAIARSENGGTLLTLTIVSAGIGPRIADGIFSTP